MHRERTDIPTSTAPAVSGYTRRGVLKAVGAGLAMASMPALPQVAPRAAAQDAASTLIVGLVAEPTSLDPSQLTDINSMRLCRNIYDGSTGFEPGTFNDQAVAGRVVGHRRRRA